MLRVQRLIPRVAPRLLAGSLRAMQSRRFLDWSFGHYLEIAHPRFRRRPARAGSALGQISAALIRTVRRANAQLPQLSIARTITR